VIPPNGTRNRICYIVDAAPLFSSFGEKESNREYHIHPIACGHGLKYFLAATEDLGMVTQPKMPAWKTLSHKTALGVCLAVISTIAIGASGVGSVSYYFLRNKALAHLHLCAPDDEIRLSWFSWWPRATALGLYLANPGGTVHIPPNYTETTSSTLLVKGNEVLVFDGPASLTFTGSAQFVVVPPGSVIGWASALVKITCAHAAVDCMTYRDHSPFNVTQAGTLKGFTLIGNTTAASGLHYGDVMGMHLDDVEISAFTSGPGLWGDNIAGFTERYLFERVDLDNNLVNWKLTNSSPGCGAHFTSFSYGRALSVTMRVYGGQTGIEVGPAAFPAHYDWWVVMNGHDNAGKTFLKLDPAAGSCVLPARVNGGRFTLVGEDDGSGGTFVDIGQGASLGGECFLHTFSLSGAMPNKIDGSLACQTYLGPTGNQIIFDQRSWPSSDVVLHFPTVTAEDTLASLRSNQAFAGNNTFGGVTNLYNELYSLDGHSLTFFSDNFTTRTAIISGSGGIYGKSFNITGGGTGWTGTCPAGHGLQVAGGIVVGCN